MKKQKKARASRGGGRAAEADKLACDDVFEIAVSDLGTIRRVVASSSGGAADVRGEHCFAVFHGRSEPCVGCPIERAVTARKTCVGVARSSSTPPSLNLIAARRVDDDTIRVNAYRVDEQLVAGLLSARVDAFAESASLTRREREVLQLMLLGRSARDIGAALRISHSTAKFHQSNVLEKLGAESRFDLIRLLG